MEFEEFKELLKDESLTLTEKAVDLLLKLIFIQYILDNDKPKNESKVILEEEKEKFFKEFKKEFQKRNKKQVKMFKDYMKQKKER